MIISSTSSKFNVPKTVRDALNDNLESDILERSSTITNIAYLMNPTIGK